MFMAVLLRDWSGWLAETVATPMPGRFDDNPAFAIEKRAGPASTRRPDGRNYRVSNAALGRGVARLAGDMVAAGGLEPPTRGL
jgi:hypothetical protein